MQQLCIPRSSDPIFPGSGTAAATRTDWRTGGLAARAQCCADGALGPVQRSRRGGYSAGANAGRSTWMGSLKAAISEVGAGSERLGAGLAGRQVLADESSARIQAAIGSDPRGRMGMLGVTKPRQDGTGGRDFRPLVQRPRSTWPARSIARQFNCPPVQSPARSIARPFNGRQGK